METVRNHGGRWPTLCAWERVSCWKVGSVCQIYVLSMLHTGPSDYPQLAKLHIVAHVYSS